jgi:hypothetical protein
LTLPPVSKKRLLALNHVKIDSPKLNTANKGLTNPGHMSIIRKLFGTLENPPVTLIVKDGNEYRDLRE